ncbi:GNAT family N-acetyltransferase [Aquicoccus sp.]|uniref:GNAT family N-acetyltransferase n=1 Tax=Aquicoccus sp. TaxID=2055851 RepID=UPI0035624EC1
MIHIRHASPLDTRAMADLLNTIIKNGGATAISGPVAPEILSEWIENDGPRGAWHVAEDDHGALLGFQWIGPHRDLPPQACDIATFTRIDQARLGVGSKLFDATKRAARDLDYGWINAAIRADNAGGLAYYQSRGFEPWGRREGIALTDGTRIEQVLMRRDLR